MGGAEGGVGGQHALAPCTTTSEATGVGAGPEGLHLHILAAWPGQHRAHVAFSLSSLSILSFNVLASRHMNDLGSTYSLLAIPEIAMSMAGK